MKTLILFLITSLSCQSFAYQYFPLVNQGSLGAEIGVNYRNFSYEKARASAIARDQISGHSFGGNLEVQYGVLQSVSIFGKLGYSSLEQTTKQIGNADQSYTKSGIEDFELGLRGKFDLLGNFLWGGSMLISPGSQTQKLENNSQDDSNGSGGFIAVPKLGYQFMIGPVRLGIISSYEFTLGNRRLEKTFSDGSSTDFNVKNGNKTIIEGFGELHLAEIDLVGISIASISIDKATATAVAGTQSLSEQSQSLLKVRVYGRKAWQDVWLQPYFDFNKNMDSGIGTEVDLNFGASLRFFF